MDLYKLLIKPSFIYKTDCLNIINIINNIDINNILKIREEENKEIIINKRPRTPSNTISNLIISPNPRERKR